MTLLVLFSDPSKIDQAPSNKTVIENNNVMLHCNATGNPASNITWTKDGNPTVLHQGDLFSIASISRKQHGGYKCTAWNGVRQAADASFSINVLCKQVLYMKCWCTGLDSQSWTNWLECVTAVLSA